MSKTPSDIYVADFECNTWVDYEQDGEVSCYLWHMRNCDMTEEYIGYDIVSFIDCIRTNRIHECWFFNLKYDGGFILDYLLRDTEIVFSKKQIKKQKSYWHIITPQGQWMVAQLSFGNQICKFKDAAKKFPNMRLQDVADMFNIPGKSEMDFDKYRGKNYVPTEEDIARVKGDTRILAHAMKVQIFDWGMDKLTMASEALTDFKWSLIGYPPRTQDNWKRAEKAFRALFPALTAEEDAILRDGYYGGWTFLNPVFARRILIHMGVLDKNSMYPSKMAQCRMPIGKMHKRKPMKGELYIIRGFFRFNIKERKFPCIQYNKGCFGHSETEFVYNCDEGMWLTMAEPMHRIFMECYDVWDTENIEYYSFASMPGKDIFGVGEKVDGKWGNKYIDKWMAEKERCTGIDPAGRQRAKLFLNSLYGKFAEDPMRGEVLTCIENDKLKTYEKTEEVVEHGQAKKVPVKELMDEVQRKYLPLGMFITAYAREDIVHCANEMFEDFVYADTDSLHALNIHKHMEHLDVDDKRLGAWKLELDPEDYIQNGGVYGEYVRAKSYCHFTSENGYKRPVILAYEPERDEEGYVIKDERGKAIASKIPMEYDIKCGGAPEDCKEEMRKAIEASKIDELDEFVNGGEFEGKLMRYTVKGGVVLKPTSYKFRID